MCTYKFVGFLFELVIRLIYFNCSIVHCVNVNAAVKVCFGLTLVEFESEALKKLFLGRHKIDYTIINNGVRGVLVYCGLLGFS